MMQKSGCRKKAAAVKTQCAAGSARSGLPVGNYDPGLCARKVNGGRADGPRPDAAFFTSPIIPRPPGLVKFFLPSGGLFCPGGRGGGAGLGAFSIFSAKDIANGRGICYYYKL